MGKIAVTYNETEWLYAPEELYCTIDGCERRLQLIIPYRREWKEDTRYPVVLYVPGAAWHRQEMYNDIPKLCKLAGREVVIAQSAPSDLILCQTEELPPWMEKRPSAELLGVESIEDNLELARQASCEMYIKEDIQLPPVLLFHSEQDGVVTVEHSRNLYQNLKEKNKSVEYYEIEGGEHAGNAFWSPEVLEIMRDFCYKQE